MADITLPNTFVDGNVASSNDAMDNFYDPSAPAESFEEMNGRLNNANRAGAWGDVNFNHIRPRAQSSAEMVGKTEPMDFVGGDTDYAVFNPNSDDLPNAYQPISGASIEFYLPDSPSVVIFTWQIFIGTDVSDSGVTGALSRQTNLQFFVDGTAQSDTKRELPFMFVDHNVTGVTDVTYQDDRQRVYSGHFVRTNLTAGWHTASLRIWASANLSRVRVRNMKYIRLK